MNLWWLVEPAERKPAWEQLFPTRLAWELKELGAHGRVIDIRRDYWAQGILLVEYEWMYNGQAVELGIKYPRGFPWIRPEVYLIRSNTEFPRRHCDPISGQLCYVGHSPHAWRTQDSIAEVLSEQLPKILDGIGRIGEEIIGEPAEEWWGRLSEGDGVFIVDSSWSLGDADTGVVRLRYVATTKPAVVMRSLVESVSDKQGVEVSRWAMPLPNEFLAAATLDVPWARFDDELFPNKIDDAWDVVTARMNASSRLHRLSNHVSAKFLVAIFPTELSHGKKGDSWVLFMLSGSERDFRSADKSRLKRQTVRTLRAGFEERMSRAPSVVGLRGKRVLVVGIGAIGAPIAVELARNGIGTLGLMDFDRVGPGNGVRWPLGETAWGRRKVDALADHIRSNYSTIALETFPFEIGSIDLVSKTGEHASIANFLADADAVIDATASFGALSLLHSYCSRLKIPLLTVSATPSLEGGAVVRLGPDGACPTCLVFHQEAIPQTLPKPPGEGTNAETVRLPGCAEATFPGASFDLMELSLEAVRLLVRTMSAGKEACGTVVETLSFTANERLPSWRLDEPQKHHACSCG